MWLKNALQAKADTNNILYLTTQMIVANPPLPYKKSNSLLSQPQ